MWLNWWFFWQFCVFVCFGVILTAVPGGIGDHKSALRCECLKQHEVREQQINTSHELQSARAAGRKYCRVAKMGKEVMRVFGTDCRDKEEQESHDETDQQGCDSYLKFWEVYRHWPESMTRPEKCSGGHSRLTESCWPLVTFSLFSWSSPGRCGPPAGTDGRSNIKLIKYEWMKVLILNGWFLTSSIYRMFTELSPCES